MDKYIQLPSGRKTLALEARKLIDDYIAKRITYDEAREQVSFWVLNLGEFIFDPDNKFNPTFALNIGKKRLMLFEKLIPQQQLKLF